MKASCSQPAELIALSIAGAAAGASAATASAGTASHTRTTMPKSRHHAPHRMQSNRRSMCLALLPQGLNFRAFAGSGRGVFASVSCIKRSGDGWDEAGGMGSWTLDDIHWAGFDRKQLDPAIVRIVKAASLVEHNGEAYARHLCRIFADD